MSNAMYERCEESTQGLEIQLSDSSHLFRHASEITKGIENVILSSFYIILGLQISVLCVIKHNKTFTNDRFIFQKQKVATSKEKFIYPNR